MGHQCNQCGVLYLALEDSLHRLQDRMNKILGGKPAPEQFYFATEAPKLDNGLLDTLEDHLKKHPDTRLIIIDTLQKIRGQALPRDASYAQDYREMETVKAFMDKRGISTIFVHHNRKMKDDDDPFNMISGTNGLSGAADGHFLLQKEKRTDGTATLDVVGRDQQDQRFYLTKDRERLTWTLERMEAEQWIELPDPVLEAVEALVVRDKSWSGTATELVTALGVDIKPNKLTMRLNVNAGRLLNETSIKYESSRNHDGRFIQLMLVEKAGQ